MHDHKYGGRSSRYEKKGLSLHMFSTKKELLIISLASTFLIWLVPYLLGKGIAILKDDLFYLFLTVFLVMISVYKIAYTKEKSARITWVLFSISSFAMLVAQHIWSIDELVLDVKPFPSYADIAFLIGYVLWIPFFFMLVKPLKNHITKKLIILAIAVSGSIVIPNAVVLIQSSGGVFTIENTLLSSYPIIDGIVFIPVSVGIMLFLKGKTNFFPSIMFFAMIFQLIGDMIFEIDSANNTYYSGSLADLFFYIPFILFMFGTYDLSPLEKSKNVSVKTA